MIQCPYCAAPLTETTVACPKCSLDLPRANAVMGPVPRLNANGLTDLADCLKPGDEKRLLGLIGNFQLRFPQSHLAIVFKRTAPEFPLGAHLFWLFNNARISGDGRKRGKNRDVLVGIDPDRALAGLTVGYGLEPFLGQEALDHVLELGVPNLERGEFAEGTTVIVDALARLMAGVCRELNDTLGLNYDFAVEEKPGEY